jgi:DNA-binding PadR family transcriptional regulator
VSRIFRRGELKEAIVVVLSSLGEAHGYAIMAELKERVGGGWKPSPGAIYPALLALVESGYVRTADRDGTRVYSLTDTGERAADAQRSSSRWASWSERAAMSEERASVGAILDRFAADSGLRRRLAGQDQRERIDAILTSANDEIERTLREGEDDG